ncbi:Uncharacterised protein [Mycobacteroides abscessus]|nr:Uncharacterised protein [Mycobacteroides abscessus]
MVAVEVAGDIAATYQYGADGGLPQTHQQAKQCLFVGQALIV